MSDKSPNEIVSEINALKKIYLRCRSMFPGLPDSIIGRDEYMSPQFYVKQKYFIHVKTETPITKEFVDQNTKLVKWTNENALIRLYGIMHYHGFYKKIDKNCCGWKEVDLLRRMRNIFTKTVLNYKPDNIENIKLKKEVVKNFNLNIDNYKSGEIPTPIDTVVFKIFEACKKYIKEKTYIS
jgi:hypothetical protein